MLHGSSPNTRRCDGGRGYGKRADGTWPAALPTSGLDCPIAAPSHADIRRFPCWIASGRFGNSQRARTSWREPFDDRITVDAVRTAQSRVAHQGPDREGNWHIPQNTGPGLLCTTNPSTSLRTPNDRFCHGSRQPCRHWDFLSRVTHPHIMTGRFSTIVSRLVQRHGHIDKSEPDTTRKMRVCSTLSQQRN